MSVLSRNPTRFMTKIEKSSRGEGKVAICIYTQNSLFFTRAVLKTVSLPEVLPEPNGPEREKISNSSPSHTSLLVSPKGEKPEKPGRTGEGHHPGTQAHYSLGPNHRIAEHFLLPTPHHPTRRAPVEQGNTTENRVSQTMFNKSLGTPPNNRGDTKTQRRLASDTYSYLKRQTARCLTRGVLCLL